MKGRPALPPAVTPEASPSSRPTPTRERLPTDRPGRTLHVEMHTVGGTIDAYATANSYRDGRPGELFLQIRGAGAEQYSGLADAFATALSIGLQYGVPLAIITAKLRGTRAQPCGRVGKRLSVALLDVIARWLEELFAGGPSVEQWLNETPTEDGPPG